MEPRIRDRAGCVRATLRTYTADALIPATLWYLRALWPITRGLPHAVRRAWQAGDTAKNGWTLTDDETDELEEN